MLRLSATTTHCWRAAPFVYARVTNMQSCMCARAVATAAEQEVAVVGGGISGLTCALTLAKQGFQVSVFDLGKYNPGGRMSTRRTTWRELEFDHGCQFIKVQSPQFQSVIEEWQSAGVLVPWEGNFCQYDAVTGACSQADILQLDADQEKNSGFFGWNLPGGVYVGKPSINSICTHLSKDVRLKTVRLDMRVTKAHLGSEGSWLLEGAPMKKLTAPEARAELPTRTAWNLGVFDALVVADSMVARAGSPGEVSISGTDLSSAWPLIRGQGHAPLFALMVAFDAGQGLQLPFDAASIKSSEHFSFLSRNDSKPGRERSDGTQCWVAITTPSFAAELIGDMPDGKLPPQTPEYLAALAPRIWEALSGALRPGLGGAQVPQPAFMLCHRWGAALPLTPAGVTCVAEPAAKFAACGDFCLGAGVENAVLSGLAAAESVRNMLQPGKL